MLISCCLEPSQPQRVISGLMTERRMTTCLKRWRSVAGGFCLQINLLYVIEVSHLIFCHFPFFCTVQHAVIITGWVYYLLVVPSQVSVQYRVVVFVCVCVFDVSLLCFWHYFAVCQEQSASNCSCFGTSCPCGLTGSPRPSGEKRIWWSSIAGRCVGDSWGWGGRGGLGVWVGSWQMRRCVLMCACLFSLSFFDTPIPKSSDVQVEYIEIGSAHQFACLYCRNTVCLHDVFWITAPFALKCGIKL